MFLQSSASESIASLLEGSCDFAVACGKAGTVRLSVTLIIKAPILPIVGSDP